MTKLILTGCETFVRGNTVYRKGEGPYIMNDEQAKLLLDLKMSNEGPAYFSIREEEVVLQNEDKQEDSSDAPDEPGTTDTAAGVDVTAGAPASAETGAVTSENAEVVVGTVAGAAGVATEAPVVPEVKPAAKAPSKKDKATPVTVK